MSEPTPPENGDAAGVLEDILTVFNVGDGPDHHMVDQRAATYFTWNYQKKSPALSALYRKGVGLQWDGAEDLPWSTPVDQEKLVTEEIRTQGAYRGVDLSDTVFERWDEAEWVRAGIEGQNWMISQFLHGEQGALVCTAKLVEAVPMIDAKYYAATQVMDEARHVEIFSRYLDEKLTGDYPINAHLGQLLDDIVGDRRWDIVYLGMQTMVEGLALAAFHFLRDSTQEPLLKRLLERVITDEARHVAFGVLSLERFYRELTLAEIRERQEFAFEAVLHLRDRFMQQEVWDRLEVPPKDVVKLTLRTPDRELFRQMLFSKVVPQCKRIGLLDAGDGWLRRKFDEIGVTYLEDLDDGTAGLDASAADADGGR